MQNTWSQKFYFSNHGELIFSFAEIKKNTDDIPVNLRFTAWFHVSRKYHFNMTNNLGLYSGLGIKNIGMITTEDYTGEGEQLLQGRLPVYNVKTKRRAYSLYMPLAVKLGKFDKHLYFYSGGAYELLFHYKQKNFIDGQKFKETAWFSKKTNILLPCVFAGIQFPKGLNISFKYFLKNFLNQDYTYNNVKPYKNLSSKIYLISISFQYPGKMKFFNNDEKNDEVIAKTDIVK